MIGVVVIGVVLLVAFYPQLFYGLGGVLAPDTGGAGGPFPPASSDTPATLPGAPAPLQPAIAAIVQLVLQYAGGQDPALILGIIEHESNFNAGAVNSSDPNGGSWGLMQMAAATARDMGVPDPRALLQPAVAIVAGVRYLAWIDSYLTNHGGGGLNQKIAAWNEGPGAAASGLPDYPYVQAVSANMAKWRGYLDSAVLTS